MSILKTFCTENNIDSADKISKIKIVRFKNNERTPPISLTDLIEYTDDDNKCVLSNGKWYLFNHDYLTYLNDSIREIPAKYNAQYDFTEKIHQQFLDEKYNIEKDEERYKGKSKTEIKKSLAKKYYAEYCFNCLRDQEGTFVCYNKVGTTVGFEKMDLYEKDSSTMFAVKKGKASSDLCYAVDQSLTALKKLKHGEITDMPPINNVGLWFILERAGHLPVDEHNRVDLASLEMLMLKNRIDQWKKEVRLAEYKPIVYINYRRHTNAYQYKRKRS